jgi:hypothetical protein
VTSPNIRKSRNAKLIISKKATSPVVCLRRKRSGVLGPQQIRMMAAAEIRAAAVAESIVAIQQPIEAER